MNKSNETRNPEGGDDVGASTAVLTDVSTGEVTPDAAATKPDGTPREIGGRDGLDPTRYGDWEKSGRCIDF